MMRNGDEDDRGPGRRVRYDRPLLEGPEGPAADPPAKGRRGRLDLGSGRLLVTAIVLAVLATWGTLYVSFRLWKAGYNERAATGARLMTNALAPLSEIVPIDDPPDPPRALACAGGAALAALASPTPEDPAAWRRTVDDTRRLLVALTAANLLDAPQIRALGERVANLAARARPATARAELSALWDEVEDGTGPILRGRHPRPKRLAPRKSRGRTGEPTP